MKYCKTVSASASVPAEVIESKIYLVRNKRIMLDSDLAALYGVTTSALIQAVRRNQNRFPYDFAFLLTRQEVRALISQFVISKKKGRGGRTKLPHVFTEQGVAMLSSVLNSKRAVQVNIQIMRTFIKLRGVMISHNDLKRKIESIEKDFVQRFKKHDEKFRAIFKVIKNLLEPPPLAPEKPRRWIGFHSI